MVGAGTGMNSGVSALLALPNGDVIAGGDFTTAGGTSANRIARWDGAVWSALGTGMDNRVYALTPLPTGDVVAGGDFTTVGGAVSTNVARLSTTCPAIAASYGAGCASSGGSNTLIAATLPWVDATFHATGTGLPRSRSYSPRPASRRSRRVRPRSRRCCHRRANRAATCWSPPTSSRRW